MITKITAADPTGRWKFSWFRKHLNRKVSNFAKENKRKFIVILVTILSILFLFRPAFHPMVMVAREHLYFVTITLPIVLVMWWMYKKFHAFGNIVVALVFAGVVAICWHFKFNPHEYAALWVRYQTLNLVDLDEYPLSKHERIQPLTAIHTLANDVIGDTEEVSTPDFVRSDKSFRITMVIEPSARLRRATANIESIFDISGTSASLDFSDKTIHRVNFDCGERFYLGKNAAACAIKTFGLGRFFNYEPSDVKYIRDNDGEYVQIITLVRWKGVFFPRPEFGGVQIVRQFKPSEEMLLNIWDHVVRAVKRTTVGLGEWVKPEEVKNYTFLVGQNIYPYKVSRYIGESFRFQNGMWAPLPWYHKGDIRISDLPEDLNDQPFTTFFDFSGLALDSKLYHYFSLEPYMKERHGLSTSLFIPSDGIGPVAVYRHYARGEFLAGVSAIPTKIRENVKRIGSWESNFPAENRPSFRLIDGKKRLFWITTLVTKKEGVGFITGGKPETALTGAETAYQSVTWVDPNHPETWDAAIGETNKTTK